MELTQSKNDVKTDNQDKYAVMDTKIQESQNPLKTAVELLFNTYNHYHWVGIYILCGDNLKLGPYRGPRTNHTTIPIATGICGAAVREEKVINLPDVRSDPRFIACSPTTRSELVVPIWHEGKVVAEIDIDSNYPSAFGNDDETRVVRVAKTIAPYIQMLREKIE
jgi:GAF domain-containing protein